MKKLLIFCVFFAAFPLLAANWYLDNSASGSNVGTSWANAWNSAASVVWGASGVKAGDTLYVSGGSTSKTYSAFPAVGASGASGNLINISTGVDAGHTGLVIWDNARANFGSYKYIHLTGGSSTNMIFRDVAAVDDYTSAIYGSEGGHLIEYVAVSNTPSGIIFATAISDGVIVQNCRLSWIYGKCGIDLRGEESLSTWDKYIIQNCSIQGVYDTSPAGGPDLIHIRAGSTIASNYITYASGEGNTAEHPDMIQQMGPRFAKIHGNTFDTTRDSAIDVDFFWVATKTLTNLYIYNNLFRATGSANWQAVRFYANSGTIDRVDGLKIFNNTFADIANRTLGFERGVTTTVTNTLIQNNVFINTQGIGIETNSGYALADWNIDYNVLAAGASGVNTITVEGSTITQTHGSTATPSFSSYSALSAGNNFALSSGDTVCKDAGTDLSSLTTQDITGATRSGTWDVGAFEYGSGGGGDVTAPTCAITSPALVSSGSSGSYSTSSSTVTVSGTSDDATATVTWSNSRGGAGTATGSTSWSQSGITLASGGNVLTFTATDPSANATTTTLNVTYTVPAVGGTTNNVGTLRIY